MRCPIRPLSPDRELQAYVVGLALGDGNLSNPNGRAVRLRIACDTRYPRLISKIAIALKDLLPANRVSLVATRGNCVNVSVYSNQLEALLGWKALGGSKQRQNVRVPEWVSGDRTLTISCLRGLIETDGTVYSDRGYRMVMFSSVILNLAQQVKGMFEGLGFKPRFYEIHPRETQMSTKYQVRLSRDVQPFLDLVKPQKD
jgi:hypothetical protein